MKFNSLRLLEEEVNGFVKGTVKQYDKNEEKWGVEHDNAHTIENWNEIFQKQADHIDVAITISDMKMLKKEIFHASAILLELYKHVKNVEIEESE